MFLGEDNFSSTARTFAVAARHISSSSRSMMLMIRFGMNKKNLMRRLLGKTDERGQVLIFQNEYD
jgi:hypothetical protein